MKCTLSTFEHRSFELADHGVIFKPQTDLAILNYIANYIVNNDAVNWTFVNQHVNFTKTPTDIGYGLRPNDPREQNAKNAGKGKLQKIDFEAYKKELAPYTAEYVSELSGVPVESLEKLASSTPIRTRRSFLLDHGFNQHVRGVWVNGLMYNVHLLTGRSRSRAMVRSH